jgi:hypothetical protein
MNVCLRVLRFVILKHVFLKMQNIVLKTSVLEPAIIPCSSCTRSWLYWVWVGQQASDFRQRQVFLSFLFFHVVEALWPVQLSVKSIPWSISLGAKPLGA